MSQSSDWTLLLIFLRLGPAFIFSTLHGESERIEKELRRDTSRSIVSAQCWYYTAGRKLGPLSTHVKRNLPPSACLRNIAQTWPPEIYLPTSHPTSTLISPPGKWEVLGDSLQVMSLCPQVGTKQSLRSGTADSDYLFGPFLKLKRIGVFLLSVNGMKAQMFRVG